MTKSVIMVLARRIWHVLRLTLLALTKQNPTSRLFRGWMMLSVEGNSRSDCEGRGGCSRHVLTRVEIDTDTLSTNAQYPGYNRTNGDYIISKPLCRNPTCASTVLSIIQLGVDTVLCRTECYWTTCCAVNWIELTFPSTSWKQYKILI